MGKLGTQTTVAYISLLLTVIFSVILGMTTFNRMITYGYNLQSQSDQLFSRAFSTNNIEVFADLSEQAIAYYDDFEGNPDWLFPLDKTIWSVIREDANVIIDTARIAANNSEIGSDAYEEALNSAIDSMNITQDRFNGNLLREQIHPRKFFSDYQWWIWVFVAFILFIIFFYIRGEERDWWY